MKKTIQFFAVIFFTFIIAACSQEEQVNIVDVDDLSDGKIEDGAEVQVHGEAAFLTDANTENPKISFDGPTQVVKVVDENSKGVDVYNETDVTGIDIKKGDEVIITGIYHEVEETVSPVIQATKIEVQ